MKLSPKQVAIILISVLVLGGLVFLIALNSRKNAVPGKVTLAVWGVIPEDDLRELFDAYKTVRPNVTVEYERLNERTYESTLLSALAAGKGPDVFMIKNRALPKQIATLIPVAQNQFSLSSLRNLFPSVVEQDFARGEDMYALPLSIDTLSLFYNRNIFDAASVVAPPATWDEFQKLIPQLKTLGKGGEIVRRAFAIGASEKSIPHAIDVLMLLMMQTGVPITDKTSEVANFSAQNNQNAGLDALRFYLQFANAASPSYTWDESQNNAFDVFAAEKLGGVFGYAADRTTIKSKNPFLNFGVAPAPHLTGSGFPVSYADYWGFAVSKQSTVGGWGWDFILSLTTTPQTAKLYMKKTGLPPALRSLIAENLDDADLGVFSKQALTARSWYDPDERQVKGVVNESISSVLTGHFEPSQAIQYMQSSITELMRTTRANQ